MIDFLTLLTFILGVTTCVLSVTVARYFRSRKKQLSGDAAAVTAALEGQLLGEAILGFGTLVFAAGAYTGALGYWSIEITTSIRVIMFLVSAVTTIHLFNVCNRIGILRLARQQK